MATHLAGFLTHTPERLGGSAAELWVASHGVNASQMFRMWNSVWDIQF